MPNAATRPDPDQLFRQWENLLGEGSLTTAAYIAADDPGLIPALQHRITAYLSERAADFDETLTGDLEASGEPKSPAVPDVTILDHLGTGGMGVVFHVRDQLDREWAMKVARGDRLSSRGRERFKAEARAMARLSHPHVAPVQHYGEHNHTPYFLMALYPASLRDRLADYKADAAKAVRLMAAVADGVGYLHANGFVHRDLKPANVLLDSHGEPAVSDLGLVNSLGDEVSHASESQHSVRPSGETKPVARQRTEAGVIVGTRAYMAPEQAAGLGHLANPRWDVFALGVMLHELLVGELPASSRAADRLLDPNHPDNPPPSVVKPGLDFGIEQIIRKCLSRFESDRYANGAEVSAALRAHITDPVQPPKATTRSLWLTGSIFAAAMLLLTLVGWPRSEAAPVDDPRERARIDLVTRLRNGETVQLIGKSGHPAYYRLLGKRPEAVPIESGDAFTVNTNELVLIELVPADACPNGFEMTAEIQMLAGHGPFSKFGLYGGHNFDRPPEGPDHVYAEWVMNEWAENLPDGPPQLDKIRPGKCQLGINHHTNSDLNRGSAAYVQSHVYTFFPGDKPRPNQPTPVRTLGWTFTPKTISTTFDGKAVGEDDIDRLYLFSAPTTRRGCRGALGGRG